MPVNEYDRANMKQIMDGSGDWFTAHLLRLIAKADRENLAKLAMVYPQEVQAYLDWREKE